MGRSAQWPVVESCRRLAIQNISSGDLFRDGCEWDSRMTWPSGFTIEFQCRLDPHRPDCRTLRAKYEIEDYHSGEEYQIDEVFTLQRLRQPFGGYRWYFICPSSRRRCRVLYIPPGATRFRSRWGFNCRLQYRSQRLAAPERLLHGATRTASRVLDAGPSEWRRKYSDWKFPPRPPWMRWKTYNRLDEKAQAYDRASDAAFAARLGLVCAPSESFDDMLARIVG
jgi:hypothetical protein